MKTIILYIVITSVLSFSTNSVFADGAKGKKDSSRKNKNTSVSHIISTAIEAGIEMESWMTSLKEFNGKSEVFTETPMELESWMMYDFNTSIGNDLFIEDELVLEDWMMDDFKTNNDTDNFQEDELILEDWMLESFEVKTQEISIDEELEFEPWMFEIL
jgi:hypothetical protein